MVLDNRTSVRLICGEIDGVHGPVQDIVTDPVYPDVDLAAAARFSRKTPAGHTVFAYVVRGAGEFGPAGGVRSVTEGSVAIFGDGTEVLVQAAEGGVLFLFVAGRPIGEPVAWGGPIVMNTRAELDLAFQQYQDGTFLDRARRDE